MSKNKQNKNKIKLTRVFPVEVQIVAREQLL